MIRTTLYRIASYNAPKMVVSRVGPAVVARFVNTRVAHTPKKVSPEIFAKDKVFDVNAFPKELYDVIDKKKEEEAIKPMKHALPPDEVFDAENCFDENEGVVKASRLIEAVEKHDHSHHKK